MEEIKIKILYLLNDSGSTMSQDPIHVRFTSEWEDTNRFEFYTKLNFRN